MFIKAINFMESPYWVSILEPKNYSSPLSIYKHSTSHDFIFIHRPIHLCTIIDFLFDFYFDFIHSNNTTMSMTPREFKNPELTYSYKVGKLVHYNIVVWNLDLFLCKRHKN